MTIENEPARVVGSCHQRFQDCPPSQLSRWSISVWDAAQTGFSGFVSELTANRMGRYTLGEIAIVLSDIFGLFYRVAWFDLLAEVRVLPRPVPLAGWSWSGAGTGVF